MPIRLRLQFEKLGRAAYGSHLDIVRLLPRLLRRLALPVYYSLGFNSKPVMVFGPALSLGVHSLAEYVDLKFAAGTELDYEALPALLSTSSIDGVRFVAALPLANDDPKLSRVIDEAVYVAGLPRASLALLGVADQAALAATFAEGAAGPLVVRRDIDGIGKRIEVGRYLAEVRVGRRRAGVAPGRPGRRPDAGRDARAHHRLGNGEGDRSVGSAARARGRTGALRTRGLAVHAGRHPRHADRARRNPRRIRRRARAADGCERDRSRGMEPTMSRRDVVSSLLRSTARSAAATSLKGTQLASALRNALSQLSVGRVVIPDPALTRAVARVQASPPRP